LKKAVIVLFATLLIASIATGCSANSNTAADKGTAIKVGATAIPHAEILEVVKPLLSEEGIDLQIIEFSDYVQPNQALADGELDANYFQHIPYLDDFCSQHGLDLTYIAKVHIEPMGIYSDKIASLADLKDGAQIAIPNDITNGGRALLLLDNAGVLKLKDGAGVTATVNDISENPKGVIIRELEAATLPRVLQDVDAAVINTNYALEAGFVPTDDALFIESSHSPYVNILAIRTDSKDDPVLLRLAEALNSSKVKEFIEQNYNGAVVPAF
jgi:D-methionine transport system substrate-binding protein